MRDFRFGFSLRDAAPTSSVREWARRAQDWGYDVVLMRDHLGAPAPLSTLQVVAAATESLHVGTFVLNAGFYRPALLARDVAALHDVSGGRLELGLGAGAVRAEFEAAEIPYSAAALRVEHLRHVTEHLREHTPDVPILIGGNGDRVLTVAAEHAQIVAVSRGASAEGDGLAERIAFVRERAAARADCVELNLFITGLPTDGSGVADLSVARTMRPGQTDEELLADPGVLSGSVADIADTLRDYRERYGLTYFAVQQPHAEAFAKVMAELW